MPKKDTKNSDDGEHSSSDYYERDPDADELDSDDDELDDDEMDGGEPECPYCGVSGKQCAHLLAIIDITFGECEGGYLCRRYREFRDLVERRFEGALRLRSEVPFSWLEYEENDLERLWENAKEQWADNTEYVSIDGTTLVRMIDSLLSGANNVYRFDSETDGAPGMSSSEVFFYGADPKKAVDDSLKALGEFLAGK